MPQVAIEKYYSFEKGRYGGPCGAIFPFFRELNGLSALGNDYVDYVPAGFLKCRGQILSADQYPNLARVLGVGSTCIYRKEGTTLSNRNEDGTGGTFQLPDLGSKYVVANATSGTYSNIEITNPSSNTPAQKAGVGVTLDAQGTSVTFPYSGDFKVPGRNITVNGNVTQKSPPSATPDDTLSISQFLAHGHNVTFKISRKINYRNDGMSYYQWKKNNYYCGQNGQGCQADANFGLAHKAITLTEEGSATGTKHKHYGITPQKTGESKSASVAEILMSAGPVTTTVVVNTANTYKMDSIAPKFILCEYLIKF